MKNNMKNLFLLPTDKPSRLFINPLWKNQLRFLKENVVTKNKERLPQNIYITSDEHIKLDEWGINTKNNVVFKCKGFTPDEYDKKYCKKIILTTDQDLIKDGVQAIDDEFIEWFCKNSSCEYVDLIGLRKEKGYEFLGYEIIIPKEEPKQETLEEATRKYLKNCKEAIHDNIMFIQGSNFGAKWQQERMYSEEDMKQAFLDGMFYSSGNTVNNNIEEWFEEFKKK